MFGRHLNVSDDGSSDEAVLDGHLVQARDVGFGSIQRSIDWLGDKTHHVWVSGSIGHGNVIQANIQESR